MGQEIRRVPPNWEHPRKDCEHSPWKGGCSEAKAHGGKCFQPLHDKSFAEAAREWKEQFADWERGVRPDYCDDDSKTLEFWEWDGGPPDREYYVPYDTDALGDDAWWCVYETVSEGTPVTPPFATKAELVDYLVANGDFWDQQRGEGGWKRANAEKFVGYGFAPSMMAMVSNGAVEIKEPRDGI